MGKYDSFLDSPAPSPAGKYDSFLDDGLATSDAGGGFMPAAKQAIGAGIKGLGQAATDFIPGVEKGNAMSSYGQSVIDANPTAIRSLGDIADKPLKAITEATGNAGGSMASMLGARGVGMAMTAAAPFTGPFAPAVAGAGQLVANVGPFVAAALPSYGGIRGSQIAADPLNEQDGRSKAIALLGAGTVGAIEGSFGPQAWALAAMKKGGIEAVAKNFAAAKSLPGFIGKGALKGAAVEGAEELVQNPVEQIASYQDPTTGENIADTAFSGAMGAIGGGVLGGSLAGVSYGSREQQPTTPQQPAPQPVAPPSGPMGKAAVTAQQSGAVDAAEAQRVMQEQILRDEQQAKQKGATNEQKAAQGPIEEAGQSISGAPAGLAGAGQDVSAASDTAISAASDTAVQQGQVERGVAPSQTIGQPPIVQPQAEAQATAPIQQGEITPDGTQAQEAEQATQGRPAQPATDANSAGVGISGDKLNREWTAFSEDSGTLGIPRSEMPQVKAEHRGALANFLTARGVTQQKEEVPADSLLPTQAEFSPAKVKKAAGFVGGDRSILVSADNHVLDGHHQWMAKRESGEAIKIIRLNAPIKQLVDLAHAFPSSETANGATPSFAVHPQPTTNAGPLPQQPVAMPVKDALTAERISGAKAVPTNKQSLSVAPAIAEPPIDVSTRTNQQLTHLSTNGRNGYKEAAIAEIARRSADNKLAQTPATASDSVSLSSGQGKETGGSLPKPTLAERKAAALDRSKAKESATKAAEARTISARAPEVASLADRLKAAAATAVGSRKAALEERLVRLEAAKAKESAEEPKATKGQDSFVGDQLSRFEAGNFSVPRASANLAGGKSAKDTTEEMNRRYWEAYNEAAKQFLEGDLTAKVPGARAETLRNHELRNVKPKPITKNVGVAKTLDAKLKALAPVAGDKTEVRTYMQGVHVEETGRLVATNGNQMAVVDGVSLDGLPAKPEDDKQFHYTVLGNDGKWIDGKFPDYERVMPTKHATNPETVSVADLGDYARGVRKAAGYSHSKFAALPLHVGNNKGFFESRLIEAMANAFRSFGHGEALVSMAPFPGSQAPMLYAVSKDGTMRQVVMGMNGDVDADQTFAPFVVGAKADEASKPTAEGGKPSVEGGKSAIKRENKPLEASKPTAEGGKQNGEGGKPAVEGGKLAGVYGYSSQPDSFQWAAKEVGGAVVYSRGDIALVEGFSPFGNAVYAGVKGDSRTRADISAYTGKMFSETEKAELEKAKADHVKEQSRLHEKAPDGPFSNGARFAKADGVSDELAGVAQKWLSMLGIKSRVFLATKADVSSVAAIDKYNLRGPFTAIRSAGTKNEADGGKRTLPNGDHYIILPKSARKSHALEALAHEIGHILESDEWKGADRATKDAVMADYQRWLDTAGNTKAADWVKQLRAHTSGKLTRVATSETADHLQPYWRSFGEYFADQVSRWATTSDKPLTAVDTFFKRIALAMRRLYAMAAGNPYLPGPAMKAYLDARGESSPLSISGKLSAEAAPAEAKAPEAKVGEADTATMPAQKGVGNQSAQATITPSDSAIYDMAREGKSAQEILAFIRASARRRFDRHLASALMNLGVKSTIKLDMFSGWKISQALPGKRYAAAYSPKTDTVAIFTPRGATQSVLHELVHAATLKALANPRSRAAIEMRRLFKHVQDNGQADGMYGMRNVDEFVAEAFSNPKFQQALMSIPAPSGSSLKSAWEWFVGVVARMLGMRRPAQATALDRAMVLGAAVMNENAAIAGNATGGNRYAIAHHGTPHVFAPEPGFPHGRFRLDKMGTGEGAQAYGWGVYFAENEGVAGAYQKQNTFRAFDLSAESAKLGFALNAAARGEVVRQASTDKPSDLAAVAVQRANIAARDVDSAKLANLIAGYRAAKEGSIYRLDIPDDVMPKLLDWDRPLSEQPEAVSKALEASGIINFTENIGLTPSGEVRNLGWTRNVGSLTSEQLYRRLIEKEFTGKPTTSSARKESEKAASEYLASIGIPGLRYLDGDSRNRPLKEIKREFLNELPEDAEFSEVEDLIGTGKFSPKNDALLKALKADDWLGFDYPAQAVSAALGAHLGNFDASKELLQAVESAKEGGTHNYVIWDQKTLDRIAMLERNGQALDDIRFREADAENVSGNVGGDISDTITIDGVERPRMNSNGKPIAQTDEALRKFYAWFKNSKVVDEQGRPLVRYHLGEPSTQGFSTFRVGGRGGHGIEKFPLSGTLAAGRAGVLGLSSGPGIWFGDKRTLSVGTRAWNRLGGTPAPVELDQYGRVRSDQIEDAFGTGPATYSAYLSMQNPLVIKTAKQRVELKQRLLPYPESFRANDEFRPDFPFRFDGKQREQLVAEGWDGIILDIPGWGREDIAFSPGQIKSATGNTGEFSPDNPDIRFRETDEDANKGESYKSGSVSTYSLPKSLAKSLHASSPNASAFVAKSGDAILLSELVIPKEERGGGSGSAFMAELTRYADENGMNIVLTADGDYGGSKIGQQRFYRRHGFVPNAGRNKDFRYRENMIRRPADAIRYNVVDDGQWQSTEPGLLDDVIYKLQHKQIDTRRTVQAITKAIGDIADKYNPELKESLYHGRAANETRKFLDFELRPLTRRMIAIGVDTPTLETFLWARHAEERNAHIAKINPRMPDGGSGLTNAQAKQLLAGNDVTINGKTIAGVPQNKLDELGELSAMADAMLDKSRELLVENGLETRATIDVWKSDYPHYVPLHREEFEDDRMAGRGLGMSVKGPSGKRAIGSDKPVGNILAAIVSQRELYITRAEKNRVGNALYGLATTAPNEEFWKAVDPAANANRDAEALWAQIKQRMTKLASMPNGDPDIEAIIDGMKAQHKAMMKKAVPGMKKVVDSLVSLGLPAEMAERVLAEPKELAINPRTGMVVERVNPLLRHLDNVVATRINGRDVFVVFDARDKRASRMAIAMKNLDADQLGFLLGNMAKATRYFAAINTQFNPIFGVTNFVRDIQTAMLNLSSTPLADHKKEVATRSLSAMRGIYSDLRAHRAGNLPSSKWAAMFERFKQAGGATGYRDMFETLSDRSKDLQDELKKMSMSKGRRIFTLGQSNPVFAWLSDYNEMMENSVRVAAFSVGIEQGLSDDKAASLAKELTVNFNKKGQVAAQAGAMYAFFNAAVQGSARIAQTLFVNRDGKVILSSAGKKIVSGGIMIGVAQAFLGALAGWDDEEPPQFVRERSLIIPLGDHYFSVPMPLGFNVLPNIGRITAEFAMSGFKDPAKRIGSLLNVLADTLNPIGNAGVSLQTIAPTVIDPLAALAENKDWTGKPIKRMSFNEEAAGYKNAKDTATVWSKWIAEGLNYLSGGTEHKAGLSSPTPDQIDYLIGQVTGGVGREISKAVQSSTSVFSGEDLPLYKVPLVGKFVGDTKGNAADASRFYANVRDLKAHKAELDGRRKAGQDVAEYLRDNPDARLVVLASRIERRVQELRRAKRELVDQGAPKDRVKQAEDQIAALMKALNNRVQENQRAA